MVTQLRLDACVSDPSAERKAHHNGRTARKGQWQSTQEARRSDPATVWQKHTVAWDAGIRREVDIATGDRSVVSLSRPSGSHPLGPRSRSSRNV